MHKKIPFNVGSHPIPNSNHFTWDAVLPDFGTETRGFVLQITRSIYTSSLLAGVSEVEILVMSVKRRNNFYLYVLYLLTSY